MKTIKGKITISRLHSSDKNRNNSIIVTIEDENNYRIIEVEMQPEEFAKAITGLSCTNCDITHFADLHNVKCIDVVEVKHGEWKWKSSTSDRSPCEMEYYCSECNHKVITHSHEPWENFCPNCGADMRCEVNKMI